MTSPPPKKRPYQRRKSARPGEITDAALLEFVRSGYAGANLDNVALAAGVSKGTIYHYFSTKHALFEAVIADKVLRPLEENDPVITDGRPLAEALCEALWLAYAVGKGSAASSLFMILSVEGHAFPDLRQRVLKTIATKTEHVLARQLDRALADETISPDRIPTSLFSIVFPIICATALSATHQQNDIDLDAVVGSSIALIVSALTGQSVKDIAALVPTDTQVS